MADNDRKQWNENQEPNRGDAAPDRNAQRGGHPGGYGPAQGQPAERSGTEEPGSSGRERELDH